MTTTCKRCPKPAVVRAQVKSPTSDRVLIDSPLCADHERAERTTVAMQGGLTKVVFLPLDEPGTGDPVREVIGELVANTGDLERARAALLAAWDLTAYWRGQAEGLSGPAGPVLGNCIRAIRAVIAERLGVEED